MQVDVITVGDALIDSFLAIHDAAKHCAYDANTCQICFTSGEKILVDAAQFVLGGNACNVGVGLSRLGFRSGLVAEIGGDEFSQKIINGLKKEQVYLDLLQQTAGADSTFSVGINFMQERTLFVHHVVRAHTMSLAGTTASWVYLTSLGKEWKGLYQRTREWVMQTGAKLAFNPGSNQLKEGRESFRDILAVADFLFVNKEEAEEIVYGALQHTENAATSPETLLHELQKLGSKNVCITDGEHGSHVLDEHGTITSFGLLPATFVEKTGAGDAYATGFLGAIMQGETIATAMIWGAANSAAVIEHVGAQAGLLTKEQIEARIKTVTV